MASPMALLVGRGRGPVCRSCRIAAISHNYLAREAQRRSFAIAKGIPKEVFKKISPKRLEKQAQERGVPQKTIVKELEAQEAWNARAKEIKLGKQYNLWDLFEERGYVKDTAGTRATIRELMRTRRIGAYVGVDPTAPSMHIGHLLPLMPLFWMYMHGYKAFTLLGGSTVKIGDPTDRIKDREPMDKAAIAMNVTKIHYQMKNIWLNVEIQAKRFGYQREWAWRRGIVNNNAWWNKQPLLEVLKRAGSMRVAEMLSRDTVKRKMTEGNGVSFAEFTYPIMQGWDWWELFRQLGIQMQIGGSDQYGNIVTGIDVIKAVVDSEPDPQEKKKLGFKTPLDEPVGFTVPLLTDSSGAKFGKSAGNAVWLDKHMTSSFDLYGYFVRRPDADVEQLLKLFTFLPSSEIAGIMAQQAEDPSKRVAHHRLAYEVVSLVHSEQDAQAAQQQHQLMYSKGPGAVIPPPTTTAAAEAETDVPVTPVSAKITHQNAPKPNVKLPRSLIFGKSIGRILYAAGLCESSSAGHRLATQQGAYIGGIYSEGAAVSMNEAQVTWTPVKLWFPQETQRYLIDDRLLLLRRGKHNVRIVEVVSDEEYARLGLKYPGQPNTGRLRALREMLQGLKSGKTKPEEVRRMMAEEEEKERKEEEEEMRRLEMQSEGQNAPGDGGFIKFPKEKSPELSTLEKQLKELLDETRTTAKAEDKAKKGEASF
ncbi:hypothetical protein VTJ49DRAFT_6197 [Mycothermus thermophilus]|uniref:Tyrosine--tRNA ligase n=1 Tax=Humicola insolens TaxID=85995 RepID=A0ABR3V1S7_HUMIN